ncbi:MAG: anti-sigma factor [Candidatus Kapabacteria bacterium]|nr:anti-sigma factor [Candidatus Kapabacteria bacterium]
MTRDELFNSGLLELYVADACTPEERLIVEEAMKNDPSVQREVDEIAQSVEMFAVAHSVAPPSQLRASTLALFDNTELQKPKQQQAVVHALPIPWQRYMAAATIGLLIGVLPSMYFLMERNTIITDKNAALEALAEAKSSTSVMASKASYLEETLDKISNKDVVRVSLPSVTPTGTAFASVFWNATTREVVIDARKLPTLASDKDYQLWAIVDGKPVDLGIISNAGTSEALALMKSIDHPAMFAITVEPRGGRPTPTLEAMIVAGKVG